MRSRSFVIQIDEFIIEYRRILFHKFENFVTSFLGLINLVVILYVVLYFLDLTICKLKFI